MTQSKHTINDCHYYYVYRFQFSKREIKEAFQVFTTSKWQSWAWNIQPMALLLVLLPHTLLEDDWHQDWDKGSSEKSPQNLTPAQTHSQPPLPFLLGLGTTHSDGSNHWDNSKPTKRSQEMRESWSTGELSQEVRTQQRAQSPSRGHLGLHRPTQPSAPQADPAPSGPLTLRLLSW